MKIIGLTEVPVSQYHKEKAFVAVITLTELQKVANKASYADREKFAEPKVGDDYPIAEGHDFRGELTGAISKMAEACSAFAKVAPVAAEFAGVVQRKAAADGGAP